MSKIDIVIPMYNASAFIQAGLLQNIIDSCGALSPRFYFVNDCSTDDTASLLEEFIRKDKFDSVVLTNKANQGYVKSANIGLLSALSNHSSSFIFLQDQDVVWFGKAIENMTSFATANEQAAIVQPIVYSDFDKMAVYSVGHEYMENGNCIPSRDLSVFDGASLAEVRSCSLTGALLRKEALLQCGLLYEPFGMYYESSDIGFRMASFGWRNYVLGTAELAHLAGGIRHFSGAIAYLTARNRIVFWWRHDRGMYEIVRSLYGLFLDPSLNGDFKLKSSLAHAFMSGMEAGLSYPLGREDAPIQNDLFSVFEVNQKLLAEDQRKFYGISIR